MLWPHWNSLVPFVFNCGLPPSWCDLLTSMSANMETKAPGRGPSLRSTSPAALPWRGIPLLSLFLPLSYQCLSETKNK